MWEFVLTIWTSVKGQFRSFLGPQNGGSLVNFIRILWFVWDLEVRYLIVLKMYFFKTFLNFANIFNFPEVNMVQKWTKTVSFWVCPFLRKTQNFEKFFKHCVCLMKEYFCWKFLWNQALCGRERISKTPKLFHGCWMGAKNFENL